MADDVNQPPQKARILVIDDHPTVVSALAYLLGSGFGHHVLTANGGEEGLRVAVRERVDLILLDFDMPHMSGLDVLRALALENGIRKIPVLMMTGRPTPTVRQQGLAAGAIEVLAKPFDIESLRTTLLRYLPRELTE